MYILNILIFPGLIFLLSLTFLMTFIDQKIHAKLQKRKGPKFFQPIAEFLKLLGKETIIPYRDQKGMLSVTPLVALASVMTAFIYIPLYKVQSLYPFEGDLIVILYLLTIPSLCVFLAGWYSTNNYAGLGIMRLATQFFSYEVPLFISLLAPAVLANSWSVSGISLYYSENPLYMLINLPAFMVALFAFQAKMNRTPFDLPTAETELSGGVLIEFSGRLLAFLKLAINCELVVSSSLMAAVFMPIFTGIAMVDFLLYLLRILIIVFLLAFLKTVSGRFRVDQVVNFCWKYLTPLAMIQLIANLFLKGVVI